MTTHQLDHLFQKIIQILFYFLFATIPLFFTSVNSELFEFNKIILLYSFTALIVAFWLARSIVQKKLLFTKTPLDWFFFIFFLSQILSTLFSVDSHTSLYGYYSRFNGGLYSTICYLLLYWAFVNNFQLSQLKTILKVSLIIGVVISIYGILEHFGHSFSCLLFFRKFDVDCWVQKVQERVFATLGQPNWLAAYLDILIPLVWVETVLSLKNKKTASFASYLFVYPLYFACLLFTKSRSGFLGWGVSLISFFLTGFLLLKPKKEILKTFLAVCLTSIVLVFAFGSPISQIDKAFHFFSPPKTPTPTQETPAQIAFSEDGGISESADIRKIVWKGALGIFKRYPLFGSGVETFAYSYYNFRPMEHNLLSEWDFLYNKAHNEYLNFLSTAGIFGLGAYTLFIIIFIFLLLKAFFLQSKTQPKPPTFETTLLTIAFLSSYLSILTTNFFGFSVVVVSLYFFLLPAFFLVLNPQNQSSSTQTKTQPLAFSQKLFLSLLVIPTIYVEASITNYWRADWYYAKSQKAVRLNDYQNAYLYLYKAKNLFKNEPVYLADLSYVTATLAYISASENQPATQELIDLAVKYSDQSLQISPRNLNVLKTRVKTFYALSLIQEKYLDQAFATLDQAIKLAPTDPKLVYNQALLYLRQKNTQKGIQALLKSLEMKPNYPDARNTLAALYEEMGEKQKALEQYRLLLKLSPENAQKIQEKINQLEGKK